MSGRGTASGVRDAAQSYPATPPGSTCGCQDPHRRLRAGVFFDGTNNNRYRDEPKQEHTNVVRLYHIYRDVDTAEEVHRKLYVLGVGSMDEEERQRQAEREREAVADRNFLVRWGTAVSSRASQMVDTGENIAGMAGGHGGRDRLNTAYFWLKDRCLEVPTPAMKTVDIFGFSRGAAIARTFVNLVNMALRKTEPNITVRFLGVYDTVGSFGMAGDDSEPGQNLYVDGTDAQGMAHFTARHEYRQNFPLTVITGIDKEYAGAHSDVGGSYAPKDKDNRVNHLAYVPLRDMYGEGRIFDLWQQSWTTQLHEFSEAQVEELHQKANRLAGPETKDLASRSSFTAEQTQFFATYVHESATHPRGWISGLWNDGVGGHLTNVGNKIDESGHRREITQRRLTLTAEPPDIDWE